MPEDRPHRLEIAVRVMAGILFCWGAGNLVMILASVIFGTSIITTSDLQKTEPILQQLSSLNPTNAVASYIQKQITREERQVLFASPSAPRRPEPWIVKQTLTNVLNRVMDQPGFLLLTHSRPPTTDGTNTVSPSTLSSPRLTNAPPQPATPEIGSVDARKQARHLMDETFAGSLRPARHQFEVSQAWATLGYFLASTLVLHGGVLLVVHSYLKQIGSSWGVFLGWNHPLRGMFARLAIFTGVLSVGAMLVLKWLISSLMALLGSPPDLQIPLQVLDQTSHPIQILVFALFTVASAPFVEECLFRGLLFQGLQSRWGWNLAGWVSGLIFAAVHADLSTFVPLLALSWIFLFLLKRTGCLFTPILAHASFNTMNLILFMLAKHFRPDGP